MDLLYITCSSNTFKSRGKQHISVEKALQRIKAPDPVDLTAYWA